MSGDNAEGAVGIEMDELQGRKEKKRASYEERFDSILTKNYDDKKTWWDAVEDLLKKDRDFAEKVSCS